MQAQITDRKSVPLLKLAGAEGFEPTNAGSKDRCLTTWRRPNIIGPHQRPQISANRLCEDFACRAHRTSIEAAPNRPTRKDAPTSLEFDRLNGAYLRIPAVKNPKHRRPA